MRNAAPLERTRFAAYAWIEADIIENALKRHTCDTSKCPYGASMDFLYRCVNEVDSSV